MKLKKQKRAGAAAHRLLQAEGLAEMSHGESRRQGEVARLGLAEH